MKRTNMTPAATQAATATDVRGQRWARGRAALGLRWWQFAAAFACTVLLLPGCASLPHGVIREPSRAVAASGDTELGKLAIRSVPDPTLSGFRLLPVGSYALNTRIELARRAQQTLDLQYYHIQDDATGLYVMRMLRDAGQRGVRVRLLLDDLYTSGEDLLLLGLAATPNVEVRLFNPFASGRDSLVERLACSLLDFRRVNRRMHNKLLIADSAMAVAGGRNLANEYFMRGAMENFVDLDTFVVGGVVPTLSAEFDQYWNSRHAYPVQSIIGDAHSREELRALFEQATGPLNAPPPDAPPPKDLLGYGPLTADLDAGKLTLIWSTAQAYADSPDRVDAPDVNGSPPLQQNGIVRRKVDEQILGAQHEVVVASPYLIPGDSSIQAIESSNDRGVHFTFITNSLAATDEPLAHTGYGRYRPGMLRLGVELFELSPSRVSRNIGLGHFGHSIGRLHAKAVVVDRSVVFIGSMNFDPRSKALNTEMGLIIQSPELAEQVLHLMDIIKHQGAYRPHLAHGGPGIEWTADAEDAPLTNEPHTSFWSRMLIDLVAPLVPESLL